MSTLQIRNVPAEVSRILKARAAAEGRSLSDYALGVLVREAVRPTRAEILARIGSREPITTAESSVELITLERAQRP
jgi:antitoxin FitA